MLLGLEKSLKYYKMHLFLLSSEMCPCFCLRNWGKDFSFCNRDIHKLNSVICCISSIKLDFIGQVCHWVKQFNFMATQNQIHEYLKQSTPVYINILENQMVVHYLVYFLLILLGTLFHIQWESLYVSSNIYRSSSQKTFYTIQDRDLSYNSSSAIFPE